MFYEQIYAIFCKDFLLCGVVIEDFVSPLLLTMLGGFNLYRMFVINDTILANVKLNMKLVAFRLGGKAVTTPLSLLTPGVYGGAAKDIGFAVPRRSPYKAGMIPTLVRLILLSKLFCYLGQ